MFVQAGGEETTVTASLPGPDHFLLVHGCRLTAPSCLIPLPPQAPCSFILAGLQVSDWHCGAGRLDLSGAGSVPLSGVQHSSWPSGLSWSYLRDLCPSYHMDVVLEVGRSVPLTRIPRQHCHGARGLRRRKEKPDRIYTAEREGTLHKKGFF